MAEERATYDVNSILFSQLILSFQASAMQQLGKILNPFTHKIERNLSQAKMSIDMLAMIEEKTRGNLSDEESRLLDKALFELRLNYVDEVDKERKKAEQQKPEETAAASEKAGGIETSAVTADKGGETETAHLTQDPAPAASGKNEGQTEGEKKKRVKAGQTGPVKAGRKTSSARKTTDRRKQKKDSA